MHGPEHHVMTGAALLTAYRNAGGDPLSVEPFRLAHLMTARALHDIGTVGGLRCCKRDSFLAVSAAVDFVRENFGVEMLKNDVVCKYFPRNNKCIGTRCPFRKS